MPPLASSPQVRRSFARPFIEYGRSLGHDPYPLLGRSGVPEDVLDDPEAMTDEGRLYGFIDLAAKELDLPDFGLLAGEASGLEDMGDVGLALGQTLTLHSAIRMFLEQVNSLSTVAQYWTVGDGAQTWFCRRGGVAGAPGERQAELYTLTLMARIVRLVTSPAWTPKRVRVMADEIPVSGLRSPYAASEVEGSRAFTAIAFPTDLLRRPLSPAKASVTIERLREHLWSSPGELSNLVAAASWAGCSQRTLQRDLVRHGLTYRRFLDQIRFQRALELLSDEHITLRGIASELHYAVPSAFTRAFQRWTGTSPSKYRSGVPIESAGPQLTLSRGSDSVADATVAHLKQALS